VPDDRTAVAGAIGDAMAESSADELRVQAALALGDFTHIDGVLSRLSAVALAQNESIDLRYAAFTSIERAGPTPECVRTGLRAILQAESDLEVVGEADTGMSAIKLAHKIRPDVILTDLLRP
jgi:hypothetical protein